MWRAVQTKAGIAPWYPICHPCDLLLFCTTLTFKVDEASSSNAGQIANLWGSMLSSSIVVLL